MSIDATRWAWQQRGLSPNNKLVLLAFTHLLEVNNVRSQHVANSDLMKLTHLDVTPIAESLCELRELGLLPWARETLGEGGFWATTTGYYAEKED